MARRVCYYNRVRRLMVFIAAFVLLTACGKKVRVAAPATQPASQPRVPTSSELEGLASYYAEPYHGRRTASGEVFDSYRELTAAHRTLPFNTVVRVTNTNNGREVEVRINDRGPFVDGRVIDLSLLAARQIDLVRTGVAPVRLKVLKEGSSATSGSSSPAVYAVQVGAFENEGAAESLRRQLEGRYKDVSVQVFPSDRTFYRVRVGKSPNVETAQELANRLRQERFDPFIVRLN